jgi:hypothetical protein
MSKDVLLLWWLTRKHVIPELVEECVFHGHDAFVVDDGE